MHKKVEIIEVYFYFWCWFRRVCAFYWATRGVNLPEQEGRGATAGWSEDYLDRIRQLIPLRWEKWLHALLAMCLQPKPEGRSTAKEIQVYLSSRFGKK